MHSLGFLTVKVNSITLNFRLTYQSKAESLPTAAAIQLPRCTHNSMSPITVIMLSNTVPY